MSEHIYKKVELVGSSPISIDEAVKNALARASKTLRSMRWFEVSEIRGHMENHVATSHSFLKRCRITQIAEGMIGPQSFNIS